MNIAAIYDKYDLWGKVRVESKGDTYRCRILGNELHVTHTSDILSDAISGALQNYTSCDYCEGTGEVSAPHYTKGGEIPDSDFIKCKYCNGTGERA